MLQYLNQQLGQNAFPSVKASRMNWTAQLMEIP